MSRLNTENNYLPQLPLTKAELKSNDLDEQCYCLRPRNFDEIELQCCVCARWFHTSCIQIHTGPLVRFMLNYKFFCKQCGPNKQESFVKKQASFRQMAMTALANLIHEKASNGSLFFSKDKIIPYIDNNWEALTNVPRRTKPTWHSTVSRTMSRDEVFITKAENSRNLYSLKETRLETIGPFNEKSENYKNVFIDLNADNVNEIATTCPDSRTNQVQAKRPSSKRKNDSIYSNTSNSSSVRKRMNAGGNTNGAQDLLRLEKLVPVAYPLDHPFNKDGYRYHLVEPDPHSPMRQKFEETELWAGKPLPGHLYRVFLESKVALALHDRAPQLKLSEDRMCVTGEKGYSMVRATHGCSNGSWYFEVTVKDKPNNSALRIGWAQSLANLQAPCGYDKFSYSWRSRKGTRFHDSIGKSYSRLVDDENQAGFGVGDVLGFFIHLPLVDNNQLLPDSCKDMTLVKFKNHLYYEEKDDFSGVEKTLKSLKGSRIEFFKNGISQGIAFEDIYQGVYYPAVSLYKNASVVLNFGPNFVFQVQVDNYLHLNPMSKLESESHVSGLLSDLVYHVSNVQKSEK